MAIGKITRFIDIPEFTSWGSYATDMGLDYVYETVIGKWTQPGVGCGLELNPDFQRGHVWNDKKRIAWLEYVLRGGRSGRDIFLNHPGWSGTFKGDFVLVDGKQRLEAVRYFMENKIKVFGSLRREYQDKFSPIHHTVRVHVNNLQTRAEVLQWYLDLNAGGVVHTTSEIKKVQVLLDAELQGE